MGHSHTHHKPHLEHQHFHRRSNPRVNQALCRALGVTLLFMGVEFAAGIWANSLALVSDAAHMLIDAGAMALSLFVQWIASRPKTKVMSFGYHRAEILGALGSGLLVWVIAGGLIHEALLRLSSPPPVVGSVVLITATLGLVANLLSMKLLHSASHENLNAKAAYIHLLSDCLGSLAAMIAGAAIWWGGVYWIDPTVTFLSAGLMVLSSWQLIKQSVEILMESTPQGTDPTEVQHDLEELSDVVEVHDLHIWSVSTGRLALSVHLISKNENVLGLANELLGHKYGILHTTIQIEHPERFKSERCYDCADA